ncbi:protocadherin beta-14-like isoform X45 [Corythoichthys intestinalis]|uniref:protocadherin beta-14-like isoform X45 n=1 Tax=Corythoichthys intestinalis TaxID=161448 RepID=UPI0025A62D18|nr:protocadherin beta-14-like isoform X45 [Corythoichthys intestinalis]
MARLRGQWLVTWISFCLPLLIILHPEGISAQLKYSILEEVKLGTAVGNVAKDLGLDVGRLLDRNLRVVSGTKQEQFKVNQRDGVLAVHERLDREDLCGNTVPCTINLKVVVENPLEMHQILVEVMDVNDNSPRFLDDNCTLEVLESALAGSKLQVEGAQDLDVGLNSIQTYRLNHNPFFHLQTEEFGEDGKVPFLVLQRPLDRENMAQHHLLLTAADGGKPSRTGTVNITVIISDVNDNAPVCEHQKYSITVKENAPVGTYLLTVNASDSDEGLNGEVEYSLRNKQRGLYSVPFDLNKRTGELTVKGDIDFEERQVYEIKVLATDKGAVSLSTQCNVVVSVEDVNDNRPKIEITSLLSHIAEDAPLGTVVALVGVNDMDSGVNGQVVCSLPAHLPFALKPSPDGQSYSLVTNESLDKEREDVYDITIMAKDLGMPLMSSTKVIRVEVLDVNDNRPSFTENPYNFYVLENNKAGESLFSVSAADADREENAEVTYKLQRRGESVTSFLNINEVTGAISALKSFDFETVKSFHFQVVATDGGSLPLSSNVTVNVFILDQNDNAPVILYPISFNGSAECVEEIPRNMKAGDLVTKVRAYDADIGYNGWLLFSFGQVTDHSLFSLDRYTGQIRTLRSLTETDEAEHKLLILVKDNGNVSLSATATFTVKLVEPKEAFAATDVKGAKILDQEEDNVTFYLIITLGSVSLLFVISIIVLIAMQCSKSPEYTSKYLQDTNYDGTLCHSIQYRSGDKRYMLVGPRMSIGSTIVPGSNANTLVLPDRRHTAGEKGPVEGQEVGNGTDGGLHLCRYGDERGTSESIMAAPSGNRSIGRRPCR